MRLSGACGQNRHRSGNMRERKEHDSRQEPHETEADAPKAPPSGGSYPPNIMTSAYESAVEAARPQTLLGALYRTYRDSGFTMAGAVAFSFLLALFPFCIFVGALAGVFGGRALADRAIRELFEVLPSQVAEALVPQIEAIMGTQRFDLVTIGAGVALLFATMGIETLRNALNHAYRTPETRPYPVCLAISAGFVIFNAAGTLFITWLLIVAPAIASEFEPGWLQNIHETTWWDFMVRYVGAGAVIALLLTSVHKWLAAGSRDISDVMPGVIVSVLLWLLLAGLYSTYLSISDYTRFYAGLSQLMIALIFFQVTAVIIIVGAEVNRGVMELKKYGFIKDD